MIETIFDTLYRFAPGGDLFTLLGIIPIVFLSLTLLIGFSILEAEHEKLKNATKFLDTDKKRQLKKEA